MKSNINKYPFSGGDQDQDNSEKGSHAQLEYPPAQIIRLAPLTKILQVSRSTVYGMLNKDSCQYQPSFPKPISLGLSSRGWLLSEVNAWIASKVDERDKGVSK
ncbi:helix-turn-helix transcriptional regulator [Inhella sp.]|uniref:helix-turn-helix transcriptional regulator n=1 Tax=Inhella sp. TaxID=1921806 RepID=UPI0035B4D50D